MKVFKRTYLMVIPIAYLLACAALATSPYLDEAVKEYNAGHYQQAVGLLGQAQSAEFNNPVLHYYLASALARMKQNTEAIREYRIALAIQPDGQVAQYCQQALLLLGATSASVAPTDGKAGSSAKGQRPQIVSFLCGCPLCHRMDMILTDLANKYGDRIVFTKAMLSALDEKTRPIMLRYNANDCPTVLFFDRGGNLTARCTGLIAEADLCRNAEQVASQADQPKTSAEKHMAQIRDSINKEAETRVSEEARRVDTEIKMIENEMNIQLSELSRYRTGDTAQQIREDGERKVQALRADLERRKKEIYQAASARADAFSFTPSSANTRKNDRQPSSPAANNVIDSRTNAP